VKIRKAYKFKLKVSPSQARVLNNYAGACRFVWNKALALNLQRLNHQQRIMYYQELDFFSKLWKKSDDYGFLKECPSQTIQQKLKDLERAFKDCFDKTQPTKRLPKFKRKGQHDSFRFPQGFKIHGDCVFLPKIGWLKFRKSRDISGQAKNITVSKYASGWYISIQVEEERAIHPHTSSSMVGIDVGIARFATLSTGAYVEPLNAFKKLANKLKVLQRSLARKVKFSNNWKKVKTLIQRLHAKIRNSRQDFLHKSSNDISKNHAMIVMEDLKIANMSKSAKGNIDNPGNHVKAKSGLNKSILDQGWYEFRRQLVYKQQWRGGDVILVNPKNTSITCPNEGCGHSSKANRKTQSEFECQKCGYKGHADVVGAVNVLRLGHSRLACGDLVTDISVTSDIESVSSLAQESARASA